MSATNSPEGTRAYRSELRNAMARETRRRIRTAGWQLFTELGYVATTIEAIADRAGVSRRTVFNAIESKAGLLMEIFLAQVRGDDEPDPKQLRQRITAVQDIDDPREMIAFVAEAAADVATRTGEVWRVAQEAARLDPEVAAILQANEEDRYRSSVLIDILAERGMLRTDLPRELLRRGMWLLSGPTTAFTAINAGLTPDLYRIWLTECLTGLLLPPPATNSGGGRPDR
jgi:AcrR family transcriptional regulator